LDPGLFSGLETSTSPEPEVWKPVAWANPPGAGSSPQAQGLCALRHTPARPTL